MNLGTGRLLVIVALVVAGVVVLSQGFAGDSSTATPTPTASPSGTTGPTGPTGSTGPSGESGSTGATGGGQTVEPETTGVPFIALNGTSVTGAGAAAQEMLVGAGYVSVGDAADSPVQGATVTTIYFRGGADADQNKANAQYVSDEFFEGQADVAKLGPVFEDVPKDAQLVVAVGSDFAESLVAGDL